MNQRVLVKMHPGYGMGDNLGATIILKHLRRHRPGWAIDYITNRGKESCCRDLCWLAMNYEDDGQISWGDKLKTGKYASEIAVVMYDNFAAWTDRPNTVAVGAIHGVFGLSYDADLGRVECPVSDEKKNLAASCLASGRIERQSGKFRAVALHYMGHSSPAKKNLTHEQAAEICAYIRELGRTPVLLDWFCKSPLPTPAKRNPFSVFNPGRWPEAVIWGGDIETNAAIISACEAFVGIDSGPGHVASATDTPTLILWTGHHPLQMQDPASNTTHLVPKNHRELRPVRGNAGAAAYFEEHYLWRMYAPGGLIDEVKTWLEEKLK